MTDVLKDIRATFENEVVSLSSDAIQQSLQRFGATNDVRNFTELKYVCYGVTVPVGERQWRIIDSEPLFHRLLTLVSHQEGRPKQYRRCYQGLLNGYFHFEQRSAAAPATVNWTTLQSFLAGRLPVVTEAALRRGVIPAWLTTLGEHRNLLTNDPCSRYAGQLMDGRTDDLRSLCEGLGIPNNSWVWDEALMAYVQAVCASDDARYQAQLSGVLQLINGRSDLKLPEALAKRSTAMTVVRYAKCGSRPEHVALRDTCIKWIGNPWLKRMTWDAEVAHEPARRMVEGWVKRRLIRDFFELLAEDGSADVRRLNYWLAWEPEISQMWFVLGDEARRNRSAAFVNLRKSMEGQERSLADSNASNNAFVMKIGPLLVIEFGVTGNACYVFPASDFRTNLDAPRFTIHDLKQRLGATRLSHQGSWESSFDYKLKRLLQSVPRSRGELRATVQSSAPSRDVSPSSSRPNGATQGGTPSSDIASTPPLNWRAPSPVGEANTASASTLSDRDFASLVEVCRRLGIEWEDNRGKGGALWVLLPDPSGRPQLVARLEAIGFRHKPGTGYWMK
ncbi:EH signature domain-containing protein [Cupriavidus respiraculi]|uniref:Zorya protein ZorC EH domain-containing protein n=1 Tax=Cupriavidus respiraculi TaxID=195930 RepID=A0ABM8XU93_9BURK|nr:EH signature domain-containing protein [Cupriavidus respiraculi]CAG9183926.1 hypothetical protein LMG21510_04980 [Cupriavidus respiraculi]